jgi:hypothetical protein
MHGHSIKKNVFQYGNKIEQMQNPPKNLEKNY